jgi:hypothetical protein
LTAPILTVLLFTVSCVSFQVTSKSYTEDNFSLSKKDTFYLEPVNVTSYNFLENEEIGYILDRKLSFAMSSAPGININGEPENTDFTIRPELIIKSYEVKYTERNYYYLSIKILSNAEPELNPVCHFTYEYNGASSIFDSSVQNLMIDKFIDDFTKTINK